MDFCHSMAVQAPSGAARWGILLAESISKQFELLRNDLRETKSSIQNIDAKFDALSERILDDVKEAKTLAKEAHDIALAAKAANEKLEEKVVRLEQSLFEVKNKNNGLAQENTRLHKRCDDQESYSRRENLVIRGVAEAENEDDAACKQIARDFFVQNLGLSNADAGSIILERCHRLGKQLHFRKRPIIVRFKHYADREMIWSKRSQLRNKSVSIHENFATEVEFRRRLLYPILSAAKKSGKYERCFLNGDVLKINGKDYTVSNLCDLPHDLHPSTFGVKENDQCIVFGGIHSPYYFMSNFYNAPTTYRNIVFDDVEHAYQYAKAMHFKDIDSSDNILCAKTPSMAKHIGSKVKNFKVKEWSSVREDIMLELLRSKFAPNSDIANKLVTTSGKSLAEAGQSDTYSIGMFISHKDVFKTDKWAKNLLGKLLMKVRQELI